MNTLARILSHGFAILVVVILAVGLIYRGELFPDTELPGFLALDSRQGAQEGAPGTTSAGVTPSDESATRAQAGVQPLAEKARQGMPADTDISAAEQVVEQEAGKGTATEEGVGQETAEEGIDQETGQETGVVPGPEGTARITAETVPPGDSAGQAGERAPVVKQESGQAPRAYPALAEAADQTRTAEDSAAQAGMSSAVTEETAESSGTATASQGPAETTSPTEPASPGAASTSATVTETTMRQPQPEAAEPEVMEEITAPDAGTIPVPEYTGTREMPAQTMQVQTAPDTPSPAVSDAEDSQKTAYQLLAAAREAYWMHDYAQAESYYLRLAEQEPDNSDSYGELGNMYFTQGKWNQAADAYFKAGKRLVDGGYIQEAQTLVNVIRGLNGSQAKELEKLIAAAGAPAEQQ